MTGTVRWTLTITSALAAGWVAAFQTRWRLAAWDCEREGGGYDSAYGCDVLPTRHMCHYPNGRRLSTGAPPSLPAAWRRLRSSRSGAPSTGGRRDRRPNVRGRSAFNFKR
jgi:hypothetical protein